MNHIILYTIIILSCVFYSCGKTEVRSDIITSKPISFIPVDENPTIMEVEPLSNGGMLYSGNTAGNGITKYDGFLMLTDATGKKLWSRSYGGINDEYFFHAIETSDGGIIAAGLTNSYGNAILSKNLNFDAYVVKTDINGKILWQKSYGRTEADIFYSIMETPDHFFVVTGTSISPTSSVRYVYVSKLDQEGNELWQTYVPIASYSNLGKAISIAPNGDYIIGGLVTYNSAGIGSTVAYVTVLLAVNPSNGVKKWVRNYTDYLREPFGITGIVRRPATKVIAAADGLYIGTYLNYKENRTVIQLIKTDLTGNIEWQRQFDTLHFSILNDMEKTDDGGFILLGGSSKIAATQFYPGGFNSLKSLMVKVDKTGAIEWHKNIGGDGIVLQSLGLSKNPSGWTIGGQATIFNTSSNSLFLFHTNQTGDLLDN